VNTEQAVKSRLERGAEMLESIRRRRIRRSSPSLGAAIERAIIQRELDELEADLVMDPPVTSIGNGPDQEQ
jgi:hypothetical protein